MRDPHAVAKCALALAASLLAACEPAPVVGDARTLPTQASGRYLAASETARLRTGDMTIERGGLVFTAGQVLYTRVLDPRRGYDPVARGGDSYAALAVGPSDMAVELRRVTDQTLPAGAQGLCGDEAPAYVALASAEHGKAVTLLAFAGGEPPGPDAMASRFCGAFAYEAPDGARTRQGVLLW